jgi:hypothetical protein
VITATVPTTGRRVLLRSAAVGALAVLLGVVGAACGTPANDRYGPLPKFLPKSSLHPDGTLTATKARPALTSEGDAVRADLARGSVLISITGPDVPGEGLPYRARATTCTWTVTLAGASTPVPVALRDFTTIDDAGTIYHPTFVPGQPSPPATLQPGHGVTFELRAVMLTGEGLIRWAPVGHRILAAWDFEVEND